MSMKGGVKRDASSKKKSLKVI